MTRSRHLYLLLGFLAALAFAPGAPAQEIRLGSEFQVNTATVSAQRRPTVATDAGGDFVVVWQSYEQDGSNFGVFARRFTSAGAALATEFQVNTNTLLIQYEPSVAADAGGDFVVVWQSKDQDGSSFGVFARRFTSAGAALATEFQVNAYTTNTQYRAKVAADADGDFVIAWHSPGDGDSYGIFARRFTSAGAALATEFQVNTNAVGVQYQPSVAASASGDFVIAWYGPGDGDGYGIFARRFTSAGAALATEFQVNTNTLQSQFEPSVAADVDGDFVIAWSGPGDGSNYGVFARRFTSAGAALTTEFQVNAYTTNLQSWTTVATAADGDFVIAWYSLVQDGSSFGVFARRFASAGAALATEFQVNTATLQGQFEPSVAASASGDFVIAWRSLGDGDDDGIFAQRFARSIVLDVDGDGSFGALTDGLLVLRYAFGFRGATLVVGVVNLAGCTRCDAAAIESYLAGID